MTLDQQVALDEALVPHASRLRTGKSNFHLRSDITSKELTLQVVYDVLRLTPFYKAFLVITNVPKIYMQKFWATATVHHHSIRFKMNNKKRIVNLDYFREMLHICTRIPNQTFDELPNKVNWHYVMDDQMFMTIKLVSRHQNTQQFGAILPVELTNKDIKNSVAYKEYYAIASGAAPPKTKASVKKMHSSFDTIMPPPTAAGTRLLTLVKGKQPAKSSKAKGVYVLSKVALTEAEKMKLATKRSLQQTYISQASGSGADKGTGIIPWVPDVPTYESDKEISWKSSDEDDDDDDVDDQSDDEFHDDQEDEDDQDDNDVDQDLDNDGDDFVHLKLSTHDKEAKDEESFYPIVQTPSHVENSDNKGNDDASHGMNVGVTKDRMQRMMMMNYRGSKRRRAGKEPESTSSPKEKASKTFGKFTEGSKSHQKTARESAPAEEPMQTTQDLEEPAHLEFETGAADDQHVAEASQHPECDNTLNVFRIALDDHLKGIRMKYLAQTIWRRSDKERAAAMIQSINKQLKTRRIMQSLEKFVDGRLYEGDFRMLQWTI
nr:hypothetical protein [Tanacetum cinerariifolium]